MTTDALHGTIPSGAESRPPDPWTQLLLQAQAGSRAALDLLLRELVPWLFILVRSAGVNEADAWDIVQETLLRLCRNIARFDPAIGNVRSWVGRIARNLMIDLHRGRSRRRTEPLLANLLASDHDHPAARIEQEEDDLLLRRAVDTLKPAERAAVLDRFVRGLSYDQMSDENQVPIGTVASRVHRGITTLRARLGKTG